jgi:hypothetical protein
MFLVLALISLCFMISPGQSFAGVGGSDVPGVPSNVIVGQTGVDFSFTVTNNSDLQNITHKVRASNFLFTTGCGATGSIPCPAGQQEDGVPPTPIEIFPMTAQGRAGTACGGINFTVTKTANPSEYQFTPPGGFVTLGRADGNDLNLPNKCSVDFKVDIKELPVHDSSIVLPDIQTSQLAGVTLQDETTLEFGSGTGSSTLTFVSADFTVTKDGPSLSKRGHIVTYTYTIENTEDVELELVSVIDDKAGNLTAAATAAGCDVLSVGETCNFDNFPPGYTVQPGDYPGPLVNEVEVIYNVPDTAINITHTDIHSVDLFEPCVDIEKTCGPKEVEVGTPVNYKITVTNCSTCPNCQPNISIPDLNCTITDSLLPNPPFPKIVTLQTGAKDVTEITRNVKPGDNLPLTNTADVSCTVADPWLNPVDTDPVTCTVRKKPGDGGGGGGSQEPYKAVVTDDLKLGTDYPFYISPKLAQFLHPETEYACEDFNHPAQPQPEVCCKTLVCDNTTLPGGPCQEWICEGQSVVDNYKVGAGNAGEFEWWIVLPKKPESELNIEIECGLLKPNAFSVWGSEAINVCAGETGEKVGALCTRLKTPDGGNTYLTSTALPMIEAVAYPGCDPSPGFVTPFHLTAYRNPGEYRIKRNSEDELLNNAYTQVLGVNGTQGLPGTRFALKACMDKTILVKIPRVGDTNAMGETEYNLHAGDIIKVKMRIPASNSVDIYCNKYSVKIGGIGEPDSLLNDDICNDLYYWDKWVCPNWKYCTPNNAIPAP